MEGGGGGERGRGREREQERKKKGRGGEEGRGVEEGERERERGMEDVCGRSERGRGVFLVQQNALQTDCTCCCVHIARGHFVLSLVFSRGASITVPQLTPPPPPEQGCIHHIFLGGAVKVCQWF